MRTMGRALRGPINATRASIGDIYRLIQQWDHPTRSDPPNKAAPPLRVASKQIHSNAAEKEGGGRHQAPVGTLQVESQGWRGRYVSKVTREGAETSNASSTGDRSSGDCVLSNTRSRAHSLTRASPSRKLPKRQDCPTSESRPCSTQLVGVPSPLRTSRSVRSTQTRRA